MYTLEIARAHMSDLQRSADTANGRVGAHRPVEPVFPRMRALVARLTS